MIVPAVRMDIGGLEAVGVLASVDAVNLGCFASLNNS